MTRSAGSTGSIFSHRLFVPGLALWFAALFGLSSLAVGNGVFEDMVVATRFDQFVPSASPPLGHAARLLLALIFAAIGAGLGLALARLIARLNRPAPAAPPAWLDGDEAGQPFRPAPPNRFDPIRAVNAYQVRSRDAHPDAPARRPILAFDELLIAENPARAAPPPAAEPPATLIEPRAHAVAPLPRLMPHPVAPPGPAPMATPGSAPVAPPGSAPMPTPGPAPLRLADLDFGEAAAATPASGTVAPTPVPPAPVVPAPVVEPMPAAPAAPAPPPSAAARIASQPPAQLSHVELIERLAIAMRQREAAAATAGEASAPDHATTAQGLRAALEALRGTGST